MRPWTQELRDRFPQESARHPDRPWWRKKVSSQGPVWVRSDGLVIYPHGTASYTPRVRGRTFTRKTLPNVLTRIDKEAPVAFPKLRAGQVWSTKDAVRMVSILSCARQASWNKKVRVFTVMGWRRGGNQTWEEEQLVKSFDGGGLVLISDQCCSHLAPWSPLAKIKPKVEPEPELFDE